jgi:hypothetical protein
VISAAISGEVLSGVQFQEALRHVTRFRLYSPVGDPLNAAVKRIEQNPAYLQSRLLVRVLSALTHGRGEFRRAEIAAFDSETLALVISLMDAHAAGTPAREDWVRAADGVSAAQHGAGG